MQLVSTVLAAESFDPLAHATSLSLLTCPHLPPPAPLPLAGPHPLPLSPTSPSSSSPISSASTDPSIDSIRSFLYASLKFYGRTPISLRPVAAAPHTRRGRSRSNARSLGLIRSNLDQLSGYVEWMLEDAQRSEGLTMEEKLDLVKLYSSIVRAATIPRAEPGIEQDEEVEDVIELRHETGRAMLSALERLVEGFDRSRGMLWIDGTALQDRLPGVIPFDPKISPEEEEEEDPVARVYLEHLRFLFLDTPHESPSKSFLKTRQAVLPLLFEAFQRIPSGPEQALNLLCGWNVHQLSVSADDAVSVGLKRRYGRLLAQLSPDWFAQLEPRRRRLVGPHLVETLAQTGHGLQALQLRKLIHELRTKLDDLTRLKMEVALLQGALAIRYVEDAEKIAGDVLSLARQFVGDEQQKEIVVQALRMVVQTAAEGGDHKRVEEVSKELQLLGTGGLELTMRKMRLAHRLPDVEGAKRLFTSNVSFATTPEERARLAESLVHTFVRIDDLDSALNLLDQEIIARGDRPTLRSINQLMFGFAARHDVDSTYAIFRRLARGEWGRSILPNIDSYHALLLAHANVKDLEAATGILAELRRSGLRPNLRVWTTMMNLYVELGQWRRAFEVFAYLERCDDPRLKPDTATLNVVLKAAVLTATPVATLLKWFHEALERGLRPNMMTYTLVMQSVCSAGAMDVAEELFRLMDEPRSIQGEDELALPTAMGDVRPDVFIFSTLISGYLKVNERGKARACLAEMRRRGIEPTSVTYGIIISSLISRRSPEARTKAKEFAHKFLKLSPLKRGARSTKTDRALARGDELLNVFAPILQAEAKRADGQTVLDTFKLVLDGGARPSIELYTILMDAFRKDALAASGDEGTASTTTGRAAMGANDVLTVWQGLHRSILDAYGTPIEPLAEPDDRPSIFPDDDFQVTPPSLRISPAHATDLRLPLSILIDALSPSSSASEVALIWTQLASEGFVFDAGNYNSLVRHFARQGELARANWIVERILLVRSSSSETGDSPVSEEEVEQRLLRAEATFKDVRISRGEGNPRLPSRLASLRKAEYDDGNVFTDSLRDVLHGRMTDVDESMKQGSTKTFVEAIQRARIERIKRVWKVFGTTWIELDRAMAAEGAMSGHLESAFPLAMKALEEWRTGPKQRGARFTERRVGDVA